MSKMSDRMIYSGTKAIKFMKTEDLDYMKVRPGV